MKLIAALAAVALCAGCETMPQYDTSHLSDSQRGAMLGMLMSRQQQMNQQQAQPYGGLYMIPPQVQQPAYQPPQQRFCQSQLIGNMRHTQCF